MSINFSDIPILQRSNAKMKNPELVLQKLNNIILDKKEHLQIISDYDMTITKQHVKGEKTRSSFGLFSLWDQLPPGFMEKEEKYKAIYYPIEVDLNLTSEEKTPYMVEWYKQCENLYKGVHLDLEQLQRLVAEKGPELRDGTVELFKVLEEHKIPILVLSAGLGDMLKEVLKYHGLVENDYFHIISNFFKLENGIIQSYGCREEGSFLHPFNKNGLGCSRYFKEVGSKRHSVILMGDSLGDARMSEGIPEIRTVLKIGFLYGTPSVIEQNLVKFLESFDIVLIDDQTMNVVRAIIDLMIKDS